MRRILFACMTTVTAVVLLFGYRTSSPHPSSVATTTIAAGTPGSDSSTAAGAATTAPAPQSGSGSGSTTTVTGQTVQTRWGPVQVQITVSGGTITAADAVVVPTGNPRDIDINNRAVPVLNQEALQSQDARIDSVSGATYTSQGYITSLQSALDQAGL